MFNSFKKMFDLNIEEKEKFVNNITFLQTSIKEQLNLIKESNFKCYGEFNDAILVLIQDIKNNNILTLYKILFNYYEIVVPYLNYHFNDLKINQEYKKVEKIKNIFVEQVDYLISDYILCIERIV